MDCVCFLQNQRNITFSQEKSRSLRDSLTIDMRALRVDFTDDFWMTYDAYIFVLV